MRMFFYCCAVEISTFVTAKKYSMTDYDVIIIGAGASGLLAAISAMPTAWAMTIHSALMAWSVLIGHRTIMPPR